ncbi:MAG: iron-containing alcohol dehydrogenase, partial [Firmicutes bacterium]|nr:iron-containing alcohol dehydrogenase [Bacillota bacterium]
MSNIEYITMGNQRDIINKTLRDTYHFVVADRNVFETYKALFVGVDRLFVFESKESTKQMDTVLEIVEYLHKHKFGRHCTLVGIGGGIVGDLVGFVASIYMRGVPFINIPTTLLSQVDSSIGGKTAINARGIKNLLGSFYEAKQIIIDHSFLVTLPEREWLSGVGEIFKTALLNKKLYEYFKKNMSGLVSRDAKVVGEMVEQCVSIKDKIVSLDT